MRLSRIHRGRRPRRITPSEICIILYILRKPNSLITYYSFKIVHSLRTSYNMLTFVDVKFTSIMHAQKIKGCSRLQIYFKQQMLSVELFSCYVFRRQFVVKRVKYSADCSAIFLSTTKTTQPRPQVFSVNGALTCNCAALLTSSVD